MKKIVKPMNTYTGPPLTSIATASFCSDSLSLIFLGATTRATLSYRSIAITHLHRPSAAVEAVLILAGSNSGLDVYSLRILAMIVGWMLS